MLTVAQTHPDVATLEVIEMARRIQLPAGRKEFALIMSAAAGIPMRRLPQGKNRAVTVPADCDEGCSFCSGPETD